MYESALTQANDVLIQRAEMFQKIEQFFQTQFNLAGLPTPNDGFKTIAAIYEAHLWENRETTSSYADDTTLATRMQEARRDRAGY